LRLVVPLPAKYPVVTLKTPVAVATGNVREEKEGKRWVRCDSVAAE
jgi:hypothetical protein